MLTPEQLSLMLDQLNPEEAEYLKSIVSGDSDISDLWTCDYDEIPVSIEEFISNPLYLGKALDNGEGGTIVYEYWIRTLHNLYKPDTNYWEIALSGAIGLGKTTMSTVILAYELYKLMCLRDPCKYYGVDNPTICLFNTGLDQVYSLGYARLQKYIQSSEWFTSRGQVLGTNYQTYYPPKNISIVCGSREDHFRGRDIFAAALDEIDYSKGSSMEDQSFIMKLYATVKRRMESRYMKSGKLPGMLIFSSSKNSDDNFLENYIQKNRDKPYLYIVDEPLWVVKRERMNYSGKTFYLAVGDQYRPSKILSDSEDKEAYESAGQRVISVPIEHKEAFEQSMNQALIDIAGIALSSTSKYLSYEKVKLIYKPYLKNPFRSEVIELGFDDDSSITDFLDESKLSKHDRSKPHFIHWDASKRGDVSGLAMTTTVSNKTVRRLIKGTGEVGDVNDVVHKIVFGIGIRSKGGQEIPFYKIRKFIYYLRDKLHYNIQSVTQDSYQSVDSLQNMKMGGFNTSTLSVDRSRAPYDTLKNAINEGRLISHENKYLESEFLDIVDDRKYDKIDHTCLPGDTLISTSNGDKCIKDLKEGIDKVYSYDIQSGKVVEVEFTDLRKTRDTTELFRIEMKDGFEVECTANHPFLTARGYVRADHLRVSDRVCRSVNRSVELSEIKSINIKEVESTPVYDIEVPLYHNFTLANGLILHNSNGHKDVSDCIAACVYKASELTNLSEKSDQQAQILAGITDELVTEDKRDPSDVRNWL